MATVNHEEILAAKGLEGLSSALDCDDHETVFNACYALNKLAMSEANHEVGCRIGRVRPECFVCSLTTMRAMRPTPLGIH